MTETSIPKTPKPQGWARFNWLGGGMRKFCYFRDGRSLCGRAGTFCVDPEAFDDTQDDHSENCATCKKKRAAEKARTA